MLAAERYHGPEPVNVGSGAEIAIKALVHRIAELTAFRGKIRWDTNRPNGQPRRALDTSRAAHRFGFRARMPFEDGLRRTIAWYEGTRRPPPPSSRRREDVVEPAARC